MKLSDLKPGDKVFTDPGFTCIPAASTKEVKRDDRGSLFVDCEEGEHHLDGQLNEKGELVGLTFADKRADPHLSWASPKYLAQLGG